MSCGVRRAIVRRHELLAHQIDNFIAALMRSLIKSLTLRRPHNISLVCVCVCVCDDLLDNTKQAIIHVWTTATATADAFSAHTHATHTPNGQTVHEQHVAKQVSVHSANYCPVSLCFITLFISCGLNFLAKTPIDNNIINIMSLSIADATIHLTDGRHRPRIDVFSIVRRNLWYDSIV